MFSYVVQGAVCMDEALDNEVNGWHSATGHKSMLINQILFFFCIIMIHHPLPQNSGTDLLSHLDSSLKTNTEQHNPRK